MQLELLTANLLPSKLTGARWCCTVVVTQFQKPKIKIKKVPLVCDCGVSCQMKSSPAQFHPKWRPLVLRLVARQLLAGPSPVRCCCAAPPNSSADLLFAYHSWSAFPPLWECRSLFTFTFYDQSSSLVYWNKPNTRTILIKTKQKQRSLWLRSLQSSMSVDFRFGEFKCLPSY